MSITNISSREFNHDVGQAKRAAMDGPVIITDRGKPSHVLLNFDDYQKLKHEAPKLSDILACDEVNAELDTIKADLNSIKPADLS